jgi:DNA-binding XRE family transcriptional regulator
MGWESPLQRARAELEMTQAELAAKAGVTVQTWRAAERSHRRPFPTTRWRIARAVTFYRNLRRGDGPGFDVEKVVEELWP